MSCSISIRMCSNGEQIYQESITSQEMRNSGYQQQQLQTDEEPLDKLTENDLFYLSAAVEVCFSCFVFTQ